MENLYYAIVIDNNDPNKKSYVKIRLIPEMENVDTSLLPWVRPFTGIGMKTSFEHNPPENSAAVWVFFKDEPFKKEGYYIPGRFIDGFFDYTKWADSDIPDKGVSTYPNPRFWLMPDNSIFFHDHSTGDKGILNSNGTYFLIKGSGEVYINSINKKIKLYNTLGSVELGTDGIVNLSGNTKNLVTHAELNTALQSYNSQLTVFFTALYALLGVPYPGATIDISLASATKVKTS